MPDDGSRFMPMIIVGHHVPKPIDSSRFAWTDLYVRFLELDEVEADRLVECAVAYCWPNAIPEPVDDGPTDRYVGCPVALGCGSCKGCDR